MMQNMLVIFFCVIVSFFCIMKNLSLIHISEPTRPLYISYDEYFFKKKFWELARGSRIRAEV